MRSACFSPRGCSRPVKIEFVPDASTRTIGQALRLFKTWFWRPPRSHGDTIVDRRVSPLELLYDLVYVAVISQAGLDLAEHVSLIRLAHFTVVFSLTWIAWTNGSLYLELHGRSDGRTRTYVFVQMGILAILAVFRSEERRVGKECRSRWSPYH